MKKLHIILSIVTVLSIASGSLLISKAFEKGSSASDGEIQIKLTDEQIETAESPVFEIGALSGSTGEEKDNPLRIRSGYIFLCNGDRIDLSEAFNKKYGSDRIGACYIYHYDINKNYINCTSFSLSQTSAIYISENSEYVRLICSKSQNAPSAEWAEKIEKRTTVYSQKNIAFLNVNELKEKMEIDDGQVPETTNTNSTWYAGKRFAFLGDSITHLDNYSYLRDNLDPGDIANCGISGTTVCGSGSDAMWQDVRINSLPLDADIIHVMGGTNDNFQNKPIGEVSLDNCDTNTFVGAYNVLLSKIYYRYFKETTGKYNQTIDYSGVTRINADRYSGFPYIMIATPFYSIQAQENESKYADAIKKIAKTWHIPCIDHYYLDGINDQNAYRYQDDDVHPNARGRIKMYGTLQGTLMSIEPPEIA